MEKNLKNYNNNIMDNESYRKAKELKDNIAKLNDAISVLDNEASGEYVSETVVLETIWCVFFGSASHGVRQEFRKFMVDLRDKLKKEFEEL
jgi:hypothetical protein